MPQPPAPPSSAPAHQTAHPLLQHVPANTQGRDWAVGDIHGHFSQLQAALQSVGFKPARDRLFAVGDLVDRGPESAQVLHWLAQPWFYAVRGNHEDMLCRGEAGDAQASQLHAHCGGDWLYDELTPAQRQQCVQALGRLPLAIEVQTPDGPVGLVHADLPFDDWQPLREGALSLRDQRYCLWSIDRWQRQYEQPVRHIRAVVHGHMTLPRARVLGNVHFIDTFDSEHGSGHFSLLNLHTLQVQRGPEQRRRLAV